jgi:hypothetical protein
MATVVAIKKQPKGPGFADALKATAKATESKPKKDKMPVLEGPPEIMEAADNYIEAKTAMKMAEATLDQAGDALIGFVRQVQDQEGFAGRFRNSWAVLGHRHQAKVIFSNRFTLNSDDAEQLTEILGDNYDHMVQAKYSVKLKEEVFTDESLQAELMEIIGDRFADFFETTTKLEVCENFSQLIYQVLQPDQLAALRTFARQYKPSIR